MRRGGGEETDVLPADLFVKAWLGSQGKTVRGRALRMGEGFLGLISVQRSPFTTQIKICAQLHKASKMDLFSFEASVRPWPMGYT